MVCEAENRSGPGSAAQARLKPVAIADFGSDSDVDDAVKLKKLFFDLTHISGHAGRVTFAAGKIRNACSPSLTRWRTPLPHEIRQLRRRPVCANHRIVSRHSTGRRP